MRSGCKPERELPKLSGHRGAMYIPKCGVMVAECEVNFSKDVTRKTLLICCLAHQSRQCLVATVLVSCSLKIDSKKKKKKKNRIV